MSSSVIQTGSTTKVFYKGIRKNTPEYILLQQAIDNHIIPNKKAIIPLKSEFTRDGIRKFASFYFGVKLDLYGASDVDEDTQYDVISILQQSLWKKQSTNQKNIKAKILKAIQNNTVNKQTEILIKQLQDPFSAHITGDENAIFQQQIIDGSISGIWISISKTTESYITIISVFTWSPAMEAWLLPWDHIISIDKTMITAEDNLEYLVTKITWIINTPVTLVIQRWDTQLTTTIIRKKISINPIEIKKINKTTILMNISLFQVGIYKKFLTYISTLTQYNTIIINLRNNGGGSLDDTRLMLNHFVPKNKPIYYVVTDDWTETKVLSEGADSGLFLQQKKIIFLTNNNSASASEILAGIAREYGTDTHIIWIQSYWKWSIQSVWIQPDGSTIKLTTAHRLLGKSKKSIQNIGLTPDYVIIDNPLTPQDEVIDYVVNNI
jgi:carboxyl-terminal processing protease